MEFNITNTQTYGIERAIKASGNPMRTKINTSEVTDKDIQRAKVLGHARPGSGHDNFLKGMLVQMDVYAPLYWWKQAQRYHWFDFISSQSTMHSLLKFKVEEQVVSETDHVIVKRMQELVSEYNSLEETTKEDLLIKKAKWRTLVASLPCGFCLGATMTTNYQQLKTIYHQRKHHKLKEWGVFCKWCELLPGFVDYCLEIEED